jgi:signal transduction histidine kinase
VYLYGVLMLALAGGASYLVSRFVFTPAVAVPARPATAWIAWHLLETVDDLGRVQSELFDLRRVRLEMSLYTVEGRLIATNAAAPPPPLRPAEIGALRGRSSTFDTGAGTVVLRNDEGELLRYARVTFPSADVPLGTAMAQLAAALVVLALLSIPLARSITAPLERLAALVRSFGAGNLTARSGFAQGDEIGDLARSFDEMADRVISLRKSEKELLANVSHELRTPLQRIRMALELVREGDDARGARYLTDIEEDLEELEHLLDDVMTAARLDLSRGTGGDPLPPLRRRELTAAELLEAARLRFERRTRSCPLEVYVAPDAPTVEADPPLLRRALDNLLDNAEKFSEPGSPISLSAEAASNGKLVLVVSDRGIGIDAAELERIFEPFYRTDRSRARATGGVGLGLALARRIVEAHDGRIVAESEPERGSRFRIELPSAAQGA